MGIEQGLQLSNHPRPVNLLDIANRKAGNAANVGKSAESFNDLLKTNLNDSSSIQFSKHAQARLHSRNIALTEDTVSRLTQAVEKAGSKGSRETLVLSDDSAFVVSVRNRTVITVFDRENLREGVVTAIDSAVIL